MIRSKATKMTTEDLVEWSKHILVEFIEAKNQNNVQTIMQFYL